MKILAGKKNIDIIVLTLTLVSELSIPESFTDAGNVVPDFCTTGPYTIKMQANRDVKTGHTHLGECSLA